MSVTGKDFSLPQFLTGTFTSAGTAVNVSETLPWQPSLVIVLVDIEGTNPNILIATEGSTTKSLTLTGSTGVVTSPAVASGVDLTTTGFTVASAVQVNSGKNAWVAFK